MADVHQLEVYRGGRVYAKLLDLFRRDPCRAGRGCRDVVVLVALWRDFVFVFC